MGAAVGTNIQSIAVRRLTKLKDEVIKQSRALAAASSQVGPVEYMKTFAFIENQSGGKVVASHLYRFIIQE